jgi:hypothetical protein
MDTPTAAHVDPDPAEVWPFEGQDEESKTHPLVEKLVAETHTTALLTAAVTSVVNAFRQPQNPRDPSGLKAYMPQPQGMMLGLQLLAQDAQLSVPAHQAILSYFEHLGPCLAEIDRYFADAETLGAERAAALHQFSLASTWRLVCHTAGDAVHELTLETEDRLPDLYGLSAGILHRLLSAAARGQSPCLSVDGKPYLPALPQRRRGARCIVNQPATINTQAYSGRLFVRDVSQGGLGLQRVRRVREGDVATIALSTGRSFHGTIVWRKGDRAGLQFAVPLSPGDPILWG